MPQKLGDLLRPLLLAVLIFSTPEAVSAANSQEAESGPDDVTIEIGSTYSFGQTPVGAPVSRSFQLVNKDTARHMRIYGFWINQDLQHPQWAIVRKPDEDYWIPPGQTMKLTIEFLAYVPGTHKASVSWYVEMKPVSEEDKDNFFVFSVTGEALESRNPEK